MPKGPTGQKRPADMIANAVTVMKIATGEIEEPPDTRNQAALELSRRGASMEARLTDRVWSMTELVELMDEVAKPAPQSK